MKNGVIYILEKNYQAAENNEKLQQFLDSLLKEIDFAQNAGQVAEALATGIAEYMGMSLEDYYKALDSALATVDRYPQGLIGEIAISVAVVRAVVLGRVMTVEDIYTNITHLVLHAQEMEELITCCPGHHDDI